MAANIATPLTTITSDQTPTSGDEQSSFLNFAPELRNRIYKYAFMAAESARLDADQQTDPQRVPSHVLRVY